MPNDLYGALNPIPSNADDSKQDAAPLPADPTGALVLPDQPSPLANAPAAAPESLDLPDKVSPLEDVYNGVAKMDPERAAKVISLSKKLSEPEAYIDKNLDSVQKAMTGPPGGFFNELDSEYPGTAKFLQDPRNMAVTHDDLPNVAQHEALVQEATQARSYFDDLKAGYQQSVYGMAQRHGAPATVTLGKDAGVTDSVTSMAGTIAGDLPAMTMGETIGAPIGATVGGIAGTFFGPVGTYAGVGIGGLIGGSLGAWMLPKAVKTGLAEHYQQGDIASTGDFLRRTYDISKAAAGEIPMALGTMAGGPLAQKILGEAALPLVKAGVGVLGEVGGMTAVQSAQENQLPSANEIAANLVTVGGLHAAHLGAEHMEASSQAAKTITAKDFYTALGNSAEASKLRARMPEQYRAMIENITKNGPVENLYVPVDKMTEYFQDKNIDPEAMANELGVTDSFREAKATGGDVAIPLSSWVDKIAGTPHYEGLADDVKFDPEDLSMRQVQARQEQIKSKIKSLADQSGQESTAPTDLDESGKAIHDTVKSQLMAAGHTEADAQINADVFTRGISTMAKRMGMDPKALFDRYQLQIKRSGEVNPFAPAGEDPTVTPKFDENGNRVFDEANIDLLRKNVDDGELVRSGAKSDGEGHYAGASTFPDYFKDKGYKKKDVLNIIDKYRAGKKLTEKQMATLSDLHDEMLESHRRGNFFQSGAPKNLPASPVSPLGFYSQLESEVHKMNFSEMPAKDLANRIKNLGGIKAEELEHTGIMDWLAGHEGKVSKQEVTTFLRDNGPKVEAVVKSEEYGGSGDGASETDWGEPERDNRDDSDHIDSEMEYYSSDDYWNNELTAELRNELAPDHTDENGEIDEDALSQAMESEKQDRAEKLARESVESDDYHGARFDVRERNTGWTLHGSDEYGWYSPETKEEYSNLEEAKVQLLHHMIEEGEIEGRIADHIHPEDIKWKEGRAAVDPNKGAVTRKAKALLAKDRERLIKEAQERNAFMLNNEHYTKEEYEKEVNRDVENIAREEAENSYNDHTNPKNKVEFKIDHPIIKGSITGNDHGGYTFEIRGKTHRGATPVQDFPLQSKTIDEAKAEAIKTLIDKNMISPSKTAEGADPQDVYKPTGKTKWGRYTVPNGDNYREVLLTLPNKEGKAFSYPSHFNEKNILAHLRLTDRVDDQGRKTLYAEENQSDWHQQGREKGYADPKEIQKLRDERSALEDQMDTERAKEPLNAEAYNALKEKHEQLTERLSELQKGVPNAPFKNTDAWAALSLKALIRMAVEQGYDAVAWTPAKVHVDRWGTDHISWVKKEGDQFRLKNTVSNEYDSKAFKSEAEAKAAIEKHFKDFKHEYVVEKDQPHWLVGSAEQRGGNADGMNIEDVARARGELLERNGERVTTKEELSKVIGDVLGRERNDRSLESLTDSVWKQMQEKDTGVKSPRKEGMEFFYDNVLPKKVAPAVLKKLDPEAKVTTAKFDAGNDLDATPTYEGPTYDHDSLRDKIIKTDWLSQRERFQAMGVLNEVADGKDFKDAIQEHGSPAVAELLGGKLTTPKKVVESWEIPITDAMRAKVKEGQTLFQGDGSQPRGSISWGNNRNFTISLGKHYDLSTFLHETGHFYMEVMGDLAQEPNASEQLKQDYAEVLKWLGVESRDQIQREHHEQWARGFEAYLREGKAPSSALEHAFGRMRDWLTNIYRHIASLRVNLSPEVRGVMDRLLATDDEIQRAVKDIGYSPNDVTHVAPEHAEEIRALQMKAKDLAESTLLKEQMAEMKEQRRQFLVEERARLEAQAKEDVRQLPVFQARDAIKEAIGGRKSPEEIAARFLDGKLKSGDEAHFEAQAEIHGFNDGKDLAESIVSAKANSLFDAEVKARADQGMQAHADMKDNGKLRDEALKAIHETQMTELLALEREALYNLVHKKEVNEEVNKRKRLEARLEAETAKQQAREILSSRPIKDATNPKTFITAERNAAAKVAKALADKDFEKATEFKRQQMISHALVAEALRNKSEADKAISAIMKLASRKRGEGVRPYAFERQIDQLLSRFGFADAIKEDIPTLTHVAQNMEAQGHEPEEISNITGMAKDASGAWAPETLPDFIARVNENYYAVELPPSVMSGEKAYKDLTLQELRDLRASSRTIDEIGRQYNRFLGDFKTMDIRAAASELKRSITENFGTPFADDLLPGSQHETKLQELLAPITRIPGAFDRMLDTILTTCHKLDGLKEGPAKTFIYRPFEEAEGRKVARIADAMKDMDAIFAKHYDANEFAKYKDTRIRIDGRTFTKDQILAMALNWGNDGNRQRLMDGFKFDEAKMQRIFSHLGKNDWEFAQNVWDHLDTYWPEISQLELELNGNTPKRVQAKAFENEHGSFRGGYYPIVYDFEKSSEAFKNQQSKDALFKQYSTAKAQTEQGHTEARARNVNRPLRLDLGVMKTHQEDVIHDLEFRKAVIDANRFLGQKDAKEALTNALGVKGYAAISDWLKRAAGAGGEPMNTFDKAAQWLRFRATFFNMAYKLSSAPKIGAENLVNLSSEVGMSNAAKALKDYYFGESGTHDMITEKSEFMRQRGEHLNRDLSDIHNKWQGTDGGGFKKGFHAFAFIVHAKLDESVSFPLWAHVYNEQIASHGDEKLAINQADEAVKRTFMSGGKVDQAAVMGGSEKMKALTTAYGYQSMMWNRFSMQRFEAGQEWAQGNRLAAASVAAHAFVYTFALPAVINVLAAEMVHNAVSSDPDDRKKRMAGRLIEEATPMKFIPVLRDAFPYLIKKALGEQASMEVTPLEGAARTLLDPMAESLHALGGNGVSPKFVEKTTNAVSLVCGVPKSVNDLAFNFMDWMQNNGELTLKDALTRRTKK